MNYLIKEEGGSIFAAIAGDPKSGVADKVKLAVLEEFSYDKVEIVESGGGINGMLTFALDCFGDDIEEIRSVELNLTAIY